MGSRLLARAEAPAAVRLRETARTRLHALRATRVSIVQTTAAAALAWLAAHEGLGHRPGIFAPVAAVVTLGLAPGNRVRRVVETVIGAALGVAVGDVLVAVLGSGPLQLGLVVALAMAAAVLLGGGPLLVSQASIAALLVATVQPPTGLYNSLALERFQDVLLGGAIGLGVSILVPRNPIRMVQQTAAPFFAELEATLRDVAAALEARDHRAAADALLRARSIDRIAARLAQALELAEETARLAPTHWRARAQVDRTAAASAQLELAGRNVRVLARAALRAVELGPEIPPELPDAVRELAASVRALAGELESGEGGARARTHALRAAAAATATAERAGGLSLAAIAGQVRFTATDLLRASGLERADAVELVRSAVREAETL